MRFYASAPSNIALIKYMGKSESTLNKPTNRSLSYSLPALESFVEIIRKDSPTTQIFWSPLLEYKGKSLPTIDLDEDGQKRFCSHLDFLVRSIGLTGEFEIRSANNFPDSCGLASSASSFAALTKAFAVMANELKGINYSASEISKLSRKGSGSSCRSVFDNWALWDGDGAHNIELGFNNLLHDVVLAETSKKTVSSSQAHRRVTTSLVFNGRPERAERRLDELQLCLKDKPNWSRAFELCWQEFWDMHALFETSQPSFGYMNSFSLLALQEVRKFWEREGDGPLVTMDAGPNVHFLWREDQAISRERFRQILISKRMVVHPPTKHHGETHGS